MSAAMLDVAVWPLDANGHDTRWTIVAVDIDNMGTWPVDRPYSCDTCGQPLRIKVEGDAVMGGTAWVENPCEMPDGITTSVTLAVPSGKLVVDDDLRPTYEPDDSGFLDYNSSAGQAQYIEAMAAIGCAYGPVLNTSPCLYRTGEGTYVIARVPYDEDTDTEVIPEGWEELAGICTDLWAYSIADHDDFIGRGGSLDHPMRSLVDVPAGTYRFTHHTGERGFDWDSTETVIYAHIELEA